MADTGAGALCAVIRVRGLVQGVGFRPAVWRLASELGILGEVMNDGEGVLIHARAERGALEAFVNRIQSDAPPLARIDSVDVHLAAALPQPFEAFRIVESRHGVITTAIVPDAATCPDCLAEIFDPTNRRYRYPFANCTHCGPRLSIVKAIPYDRATTSMAAFTMCDACAREYADPADRRFHAQPNACSPCGPKVWLERAGGKVMEPCGGGDPIEAAARLIGEGQIVAIKGIGGFHLACDAGNDAAVARLRAAKHRAHKPLALMARDEAMILRYGRLGDDERALLRSPAAPIVLIEKAADGEALSERIAPNHRHLGFMLPYTPLHHLLLAALPRPIVLTSGNRSDEPQCTTNADARDKLGAIADAFLMHDRDIVNRLDDSVVRVVGGSAQVIRRARGFAPTPLALPDGFEGAPAILAMGADLKSTFCLLSEGRANLSQHMGDLSDPATCADYRKGLALYEAMFAFSPEVIAIDRHPDYISARMGRALSAEHGRRLKTVQHHHAHVCAVIGEHRIPRGAGPVLGIALDGLGFGEGEDPLWGGEFLLADYSRFRRLAHFAPAPLIGGEKAAREPWRNLAAHVHRFIGWDAFEVEYGHLEVARRLGAKPLGLLWQMLDRRLNVPPTTSAGRLFDAVAAALGICFDGMSYEGQAAMELEALATGAGGTETNGYEGEYKDDEPAVIDWRRLWRELFDDLARGTPAHVVAARFHVGLAETLASAARTLANKAGVATVVLSGGVFHNALLLTGVKERLAAHGLTVLAPKGLPAGDGAIAYGQALIAAAEGSS